MFTLSTLMAFNKRPLTQCFQIVLYIFSVRNFPPDMHVDVAGCNIPVTDSLLTLGITLHSRLSFDSHVSQLCKQSFFHL
jgi:hypothetical protein